MSYETSQTGVSDLPKIIIVGGGWAGLAAATKLVQSGAKVTLFERNKELGGRASSFYDSDFGEWLDDGPHIFIGAYTTALGLLETWGVQDLISFDDGDEIPFIYSNGKEIQLKLGSRGGALGAFSSLMTFKGMTFSERLKTARVAKAMLELKVINPQSEPTVADFLSKYGIKEGDCGGFWDAVTVAVMNAPTKLAGLKPLVGALKEGLLVGGKAGRIGMFLKPFQQSYIEPAKKYLIKNGVDVRIGTSVDSLIVNNDDYIAGVKTANKQLTADKVILAIPPKAVLQLLPVSWQEDSYFARLNSFRTTPIASVHITFDRPVLKSRFACLPGAFTHWVFSRGERERQGWSKVSTVISNVPGKNEMTLEEIEKAVLKDLLKRLPEASNANVKHIRGIRTMNATVLLEPGSELIRPISQTPIRGLFLAGDWCKTGLPATIESAARSGEQAAK
ncbi:MAG: hydroxysqualene dehydroxylase HpnE [Candidatus Hatepunaea meridiana]|nr:hydroxysqualene dehydroxylase HpnE [Candidatus Hatepunaea meridiana]